MELDKLFFEKRVELFREIANGEKIPIPKIAAYAHRVRVLRQFLELGIIQREKDAKDDRRFLWSLTEKGEKLWEELAPIIANLGWHPSTP